jgi:hypothetical protein
LFHTIERHINLREALALYYENSSFADEILADLIQQGYSGDALLTEFKKSAERFVLPWKNSLRKQKNC